jgi:GTP-binding protein
MRVLARFLTAATKVEHFPAPNLPEVAFLGRSNVGKSSVINSLLGTKIAKTSSTPGRTQSINFFEVRWAGKPQPELLFTDLPGYGYARVPREISQQWGEFIDPYLKERPSLALCLILIDPNVPPQAGDKQLVEFLSMNGRRFLIVATKSDRLSGNKLRSVSQTLLGEFAGPRLIPYSSKTGLGRDELWQEIRSAVENHRAATL